MALLSESIAVGVLLMLIFGSAAIYLYSRITYTEKRLGMMESLLVDIKMMIESTEQGPPVLPVASVHSYQPPSFETKVETVKPEPEEDESVYADVLQQTPDVSGEAPPVAPVTNTVKVGPNYDAMTRTELVALVEQRGGRTTKRTGRGELINMLRTLDASKNEAAVSGDAVAEPVGGDLSVDTGSGTTNGSELEEATL